MNISMLGKIRLTHQVYPRKTLLQAACLFAVLLLFIPSTSHASSPYPELVTRARLAWSRGKYQEAAVYYETLAKLEQDNFTYPWYLGRCLMRLKRKQEALDLFYTLDADMAALPSQRQGKLFKEIHHTKKWINQLKQDLAWGWITIADHGRYFVRDDHRPFFPVLVSEPLPHPWKDGPAVPVGRIKANTFMKPSPTGQPQWDHLQAQRIDQALAAWEACNGYVIFCLSAQTRQSVSQAIAHWGKSRAIMAWCITMTKDAEQDKIREFLEMIRKEEIRQNPFGKYHLLAVSIPGASIDTIFLKDPQDLDRLLRARKEAQATGATIAFRGHIMGQQTPVMLFEQPGTLDGLIQGNSWLSLDACPEWVFSDLLAQVDWGGFQAQYLQGGCELVNMPKGKVQILSDGTTLLCTISEPSKAKQGKQPYAPAALLKPGSLSPRTETSSTAKLIIRGLNRVLHECRWYDATTGRFLSKETLAGPDITMAVPAFPSNRLLLIPTPLIKGAQTDDSAKDASSSGPRRRNH